VDLETEAALSAHASSLLERSGASAVEFRFRGPVGGMNSGTLATAATLDASWAAAGECATTVIADRPVHSQIEMNSDSTEGGWVTRPDLYVTFRKPIEADHDKNLKSIPRKQRAMVRKGIQNGLRSFTGRDVRQLHGVYAESVRNLGTPVFSRRYLAMLADVFGRDCDILTVLDGDNPIASVMNFYFRDEVLPYYGGGTAFARQRAANDFMYWEVMRRAADRGCRLFDFGRSKLSTGAFDFKKNWGFAPEHLSYRYKLAPGASIPDHNPLNPKYRYFIAAWKRLPLPIANAIGPSIVRGLG
jgi:FemAB-related protein (PEP-CTERM system-associated)